MTRRMLCCWVLLAGGAWPAKGDETLESVEKKLIELCDKVTSMESAYSSVQDIEFEGTETHQKSSGTYAYQKKGDKILYRAESTMDTVSRAAGQENKQGGKTITVCDGEFTYMLSDASGQQMAMKMKAEGQEAMGLSNKALFESLRESYTLKLLPEETVDGHAVYVVEAQTRDASAAAGSMVRLLNYFDKQHGLIIKTIGFDAAGKSVMTSTVSDVKINPTFPPDRFVFTAPPGVEVMDMSQFGQGSEDTPALGEPTGDDKK